MYQYLFRCWQAIIHVSVFIQMLASNLLAAYATEPLLTTALDQHKQQTMSKFQTDARSDKFSGSSNWK